MTRSVALLFPTADVAPVVTSPGAISGGGKIGVPQSVQGVTYTGLAAIGYSWRVDGVEVATSTTYTPIEPDDESDLTCRVTATNAGGSDFDDTAAVEITYVAPVIGTLADRTYGEGAGVQTFSAAAQTSASGDADLSGVTFSLDTPPTGVTINSGTGVVSVDTDATGDLAAVEITVIATNSGGAAEGTFDLTVEAALEWVLVGSAALTPIAAGAGTVQRAIPGSTQENDVVVVVVGCDAQFDTTRLPGLTQIGFSGAGASPAVEVGWTRLGSTPATEITVNQVATRIIAGAIQVWRNADPTVAIDATLVTTAGGSGLPNAPSITTATANALVLAFGAVDDDDDAAGITAPAGYSNLRAADTGQASSVDGATVMMASKIVAEAGAEDPGAFGGAIDDAWISATVALRKATGGPPPPVEEQPEYVGDWINPGFSFVLELQQAQAMVAIDLDDHFSGGNLTYTITRGALPPGVTLASGVISGTPTGVRQSRWFKVRASNGEGFAEHEILLAVRPRKDVSPFDGTAWNPTYTFVGGSGAPPSTATLTGRSNVLIDLGNYNNGLTLIDCDNVLIIDTRVIHNNDNRDCIRLERCGRVLAWNVDLSGARDGFKIAGGDWPASGPDLYLLNSYIFECGNNASPKEHGAYTHSMCHIGGCVFYDHRYGNAVSLRSSADVYENFVYNPFPVDPDDIIDGGLSSFDDHAKSGTRPVNYYGNVIVRAQSGIILRTVTQPANRPDDFNIEYNRGANVGTLIDIRSGYTGVVTQSENSVISEAAALALFPRRPWAGG